MEESTIYESYEKIKSKIDFEIFLRLLLNDFEKNKSDWDNDNLEDFLSGLYGYNFESDDSIQPTWKLFAEMLLAARVYE